MSQYTMQTTKMFGVRDGVYWEANLLLDGNKIGTILQEGRGGDEGDSIYFQSWENVKPGTPWQPSPAPYVKPKRWSVDWNHYLNSYVIDDGERRIQLEVLQSKDAAQRICDIYNEVMP